MGSSGSLLADKRFAYAEALAADGDLVAAADLFAQAIEQAPGWAPAYLAQGLALERIGEADAALKAFEAAHSRDTMGHLGATLHVARLRGTAPAGMPATYVAALFDQYAPRFDAHLVEDLDYRGPAVIAAALGRTAPAARFTATLDLGCGTGLMARALARTGTVLDGIDLSGAMLRQAEATGLYRHLWQGDCVAVAGRLAEAAYDLAVAADVLVYLGDLLPLFGAIGSTLIPGGLFAATLQAQDEDGFTLGPDLRFRHNVGYLRESLAAAGFTPALVEVCVTRTEAGRDVPGLVFVAHRS